MATHSSTLAGKIPRMEEPGRLQSMGSLESDTPEWLHFHFSLSCIGEGNGNPLQCSCLENPRDGGAWWAAVYGVAQSQTRLKRLSSSSSNLVEKSLGEEDLSSFFLFLHGPVPVSDISKVVFVDPILFSGWLPMGWSEQANPFGPHTKSLSPTTSSFIKVIFWSPSAWL